MILRKGTYLLGKKAHILRKKILLVDNNMNIKLDSYNAWKILGKYWVCNVKEYSSVQLII